MIKLDIVSDTVCPWCYIGKRRLEKALAARPQPGLEIEWRPFQLNPDMPAGGMDRTAYLEAKFGGGPAATAVYRPVEEAGRAEGIPFAFDLLERTPNTLDSHRLIRRAGAEGCQDALVEALFRAYFTEGVDIGSIDRLVEVAAAIGMDPVASRAYLEGDEDRRLVEAEDLMARQSGVRGVPAFIFERKYLVSGAQPPEAFWRVFDTLAAEAVAAE